MSVWFVWSLQNHRKLLWWQFFLNHKLFLNSFALTRFWQDVQDDDVFQMASTQHVSVLCKGWEHRGYSGCSTDVRIMCATWQPQRSAGATCGSCGVSAKWNCHQTSPEVLENLVLLRDHNTLYFCQTKGLQLEQQYGSRDMRSHHEKCKISITGLHLFPRNSTGRVHTHAHKGARLKCSMAKGKRGETLL